jgi:hypothetical protein
VVCLAEEKNECKKADPGEDEHQEEDRGKDKEIDNEDPSIGVRPGSPCLSNSPQT